MPAAPAPRLLACPCLLLRPEPLVGEGAGQQQQAEGDEGESPCQLFQLGEVVGPDLGDREREQRQAAEAGFRRAPHHAPDDRAEPVAVQKAESQAWPISRASPPALSPITSMIATEPR